MSTGSRDVRLPRTQNEHYWAIIMMRGLTPHERLVAHTLHALCYVRGDATRDVAKAYLAAKCEMGESTVARIIVKLVGVGLFDRVDGKRGGYAGCGRATYRPMLPTWWCGKYGPKRGPAHAPTV